MAADCPFPLVDSITKSFAAWFLPYFIRCIINIYPNFKTRFVLWTLTKKAATCLFPLVNNVCSKVNLSWITPKFHICIYGITVFKVINFGYTVGNYALSQHVSKAINHYFLCPQRNFGRHIVIALSVRPSVSPSVRQSVRPAFVSGPYLIYSLR